MNYFTLEDAFDFVETDNVVDFVQVEGLSKKAQALYDFLLFKQKQAVKAAKQKGITPQSGKITFFNNGYKLVQEGDALYLTIARSTIAEKMGMAIGTVRKYLEELAGFGFIVDIRSGLNKCNKLFIRWTPGAKRYSTIKKEAPIKETPSEEENKKGAETAIPTPQPESIKETGIIKKVKTIISPLFDICPPSKYIKQLLILCNEDLTKIEDAVRYCLAKPGIDDMAAYLTSTINNEYWIDKSPPKPKRERSKANYVPKKKESSFTKVEKHGDGFNTDNLWILEQALRDLQNGRITKEQYQEIYNNTKTTK